MEIINYLISFILHIDQHLIEIVNHFGDWTYLIIFLIIFIETGAVILPFLPGDSLLFAAAALSANASYNLDIWIFILVFLSACILGDSLNFFIGHKIGNKITQNKVIGKFIKQENLDQANKFFEKHGPIAIFFARFLPIIRTFAPLVASSSGYNYKKFLKYNLIAAFSWVTICCGAGYFFGNIPVVQNNFSLVVLLIIIISLLPILITFIKSKLSKKEVD